MKKAAALWLAAVVLTGCAVSGLRKEPAGIQSRSPVLIKVSPKEYPSLLDGGDPASLAIAVENSIQYFKSLPVGSIFDGCGNKLSAEDAAGSLSDFREFLASGPSATLVREYVRTRFDVCLASGGEDGQVLFTGYYTPELHASLEPDEKYRYPLYGLPDDLIAVNLGIFRDKYRGEKITGRLRGGKLVPYYSRELIEGGSLSGRGLEMAWCDDPVEVFFLQIQGSGILLLPNGSRMNVNYAGENGRPYRSVGKLLIERGLAKKEEMSMEFIRAYLRAHSGETKEILDYNESYVFFRLAEVGPVGCLGVPVTGGRSVAADPAIYPLGLPAFIETEVPAAGEGWAPVLRPWARFVMAQDSGGAIKGPGRIDIYFGSGTKAAYEAGYMARKGRLYFLVPRTGIH